MEPGLGVGAPRRRDLLLAATILPAAHTPTCAHTHACACTHACARVRLTLCPQSKVAH